MNTIILINVTARDIEHGKESDCFQCPIARAAGRRLGPDYHPRVSGSYIDLLCGARREQPVRRTLPAEAVEFIDNFDCYYRKRAKPFSFYLAVPDRMLLHRKPHTRQSLAAAAFAPV